MVGRPREFEVEEVLDLSIELFREYGYDATTIQDVVDFTGVGRQSLYNAFGDKRALFLAALDHYVEQDLDTLEPLRRRGADLETLREFFHGRIEHLAETEPARACFVASCAVEVGERDDEVAARIVYHAEELEDVYAKVLRAARRKGQLASGVILPAAVRMLLSITHGLTVMARCGADEAALYSAVDAAFTGLQA